jgi:hypothetical protein
VICFQLAGLLISFSINLPPPPSGWRAMRWRHTRWCKFTALARPRPFGLPPPPVADSPRAGVMVGAIISRRQSCGHFRSTRPDFWSPAVGRPAGHDALACARGARSLGRDESESAPAPLGSRPKHKVARRLVCASAPTVLRRRSAPDAPSSSDNPALDSELSRALSWPPTRGSGPASERRRGEPAGDELTGEVVVQCDSWAESNICTQTQLNRRHISVPAGRARQSTSSCSSSNNIGNNNYDYGDSLALPFGGSRAEHRLSSRDACPIVVCAR